MGIKTNQPTEKLPVQTYDVQYFVDASDRRIKKAVLGLDSRGRVVNVRKECLGKPTVEVLRELQMGLLK